MKRFAFPIGRLARLVGTAAMVSTLLGSDCEGNLVSDPTFRDWCGPSLCSWQTDSGSILRVPTWNASDFGVALVERGTQISQKAGVDAPSCILFTTVANIDPSAQVRLTVDFDADGTVERTLDLGASQWHQVRLEVTAPPRYDGIRFAIRKDGNGTAILAEIRIQDTTGCAGTPTPVQNLLLGEPCATDDECESGVCNLDTAKGSSLCAQCSAAQPCASGVCAIGILAFTQCNPGQGLGEAGDLCVTAEDCASRVCNGVTLTPYADEDAGTCNLEPASASDAGVEACGPKSRFGVHGGRCL